MSTEQFTTLEEVDAHFLSSTAIASPDPELARLEALLFQCQQQIARHSLSLSYLWLQRDEIRDSLRSLRRRRDMAALEALLRPVTFYSIEEVAAS